MSRLVIACALLAAAPAWASKPEPTPSPSAVSRQPSAVSRQPSAVSRQPSSPPSPSPPPLHLTWSFPEDEIAAIEIDVGDLSASRFPTEAELVRYLAGLRTKKKPPKAGTLAAPQRELRVDHLDADGKLRSTSRYVAPLADWRKRLGEPMVERLEDEFDAHLRMLLPRKIPPKPARDAPDEPATPPSNQSEPPPTGERSEADSLHSGERSESLATVLSSTTLRNARGPCAVGGGSSSFARRGGTGTSPP